MMIQPENFLTTSLSQASSGMAICRILSAAINAVNPYQAVINHLKRVGNVLNVGQKQFRLSDYRHIFIIGAGKASVPMALATSTILAEQFTQGIVITKEGHGVISDDHVLPDGLEIIEAGHPLPDTRGVIGTQKIISLLKKTGQNDLVICLISGGGSALLVSPAPGITLNDIQSITSLLLSCGASIQEINCIRKHLDMVKGGQLARMAFPSTTLSLILSDVVGDPLDMIASGPTVSDPTYFKQALDILSHYDLANNAPQSVIHHLNNGIAGLISETPKLDDPIGFNVTNMIIGSNRLALEAALDQACQEGFHTLLLTTHLQGEACQAGKILASIAREAAQSGRPIPRPGCIFLGGETTVTITGSGKGGRNLETALAAVQDISGLERTMMVTLATDGNDGPTDAAGAVVSGDTYKRAQILGLVPMHYLNENDSYNFFAPLSDIIITGPTQTNVNDLVLIITY